MAFLSEDDDAMRAFEAVLHFVEDFSEDETSSAAPLLDGSINREFSTTNGPEMPSNGAPNFDHTKSVIMSSKQSVTQPNCNGTAPRPVSEVVKARRRAADNARKRMLRKAGVYGDPNRARNERRLEIAYLREKVGHLETELQTLQERKGGANVAVLATQHKTITSTNSSEVQGSSIWKGFASRQKTRREKAERENVRLKLVLEGQIKVAKSLESLLQKRAQQQIAECSTSIRKPGDICPPGRTLDFRADAADFQELLEYLDAAYSEVDAVLAANGLASMELTQQDLHMREGVDGMYLEVFSNKVMPFGLHATGEATWNYFKGSEKHRGNLYAKATQVWYW
ncbi:M96 mating-specific protein family [Phytophthora palmivora]|uniref:M96 mating-specific protein family n=1 Tax=Phytophthora palmivora TaxID=4796 RepID=A0A2P4X5P1_9STRA|nr:M96 mating-specific protein family [Phytophthora palmivora]